MMSLFFFRTSFGSEIARETKTQETGHLQPTTTLAERVYGWYHYVFGGRGYQKIMEVMMLIRITRESVKFIGCKSIQESL